MKGINDTGSLKQFDKLVSNYLKDGYQLAILHKDTTGIFLKLVHKNGNRISGQYDYVTGKYRLF